MSSETSMSQHGMNRTLRENIATLAERRRREFENASLTERISQRITRFTGSMRFVIIHALVFGAWALVNGRIVAWLPAFDPTFVLLATIASVEAIFLSTFVLIAQNQMMAAADRRADLDLHISLLAEHELTRLAALTERIAMQMGVSVDDPEFEEIKADVEPTKVIEALEETERQART